MSIIPRISIITITYRDPEGLRDTMRSLMPLQAVSWSWEHIVVDSSPEVSSAVLKEAPQNWPLSYLSCPPRGIYPAMNQGVKAAKGKYLWFLNGRDRLASLEVLQKVLDELDQSPQLDLVCAAVDRVRNGQFQYRWSPGSDFFRSLLGGCGVCHQGMVYRRESFLRVGLYREDYKLGGDYEHHLRLWEAGTKIKMVQESLAQFDASGMGSTGYWTEFGEIRRIHSEHSRNWSISVRLRQGFWRKMHVGRVLGFKYAQKIPFSNFLRQFYVKWKRRKTSLLPNL